jgi:conjugal transfer pilus assembly protein TraF
MFRTASLFLLGLTSCVAALAQPRNQNHPSQFDAFKGEGYYWYKDDVEEVPPPKFEPPPKPVVTTKPSEPAPPKVLSAEWLRVNMPKLLELATDNPTTENVSNYMYAQRILLDKSQTVSEKAKEVVATDPFLDENNRFPVAQFAQLDFQRVAKKAQDSALLNLGSTSGLWVFIDTPDKCSACESYVQNILVGSRGTKGIATQYGFDFRKIYVNTPEGKAAAKRLNLKVAPTTVLVVPPNGFYLVSQGLMAQNTLSDRLLLAAKVSGNLSKEVEEQISPYKKGVLTTEQINSDLTGKDPSEVMKNMRESIKGKE